MLRVSCADVEATHSVAKAVAAVLRPGDVVLLEGELGSGKTTWTQGLARALGVHEQVTSPTFTLVRTYPTDAGFELCHVDLYRLDRVSEVFDLGLAEMLDYGAVAVVEWGEKAADVLTGDHLDVTFSRVDGGDGRVVTLNPQGTSWERRLG